MAKEMYALLVVSENPIRAKGIKNHKGVISFLREEFKVNTREGGTTILIPVSSGSDCHHFDCPGCSVPEAVMERLKEIFNEDYRKQ